MEAAAGDLVGIGKRETGQVGTLGDIGDGKGKRDQPRAETAELKVLTLHEEIVKLREDESAQRAATRTEFLHLAAPQKDEEVWHWWFRETAESTPPQEEKP
jgi:hypothetical protein